MRIATGIRVKMTPLAIAQRLQGRLNRRTGLVVRVYGPDHIGVRRDGCKAAERYHADYWTPA